MTCFLPGDSAVYLFQVEFSSLDFLLHTKALLSTINYLTNAVPPELSAAGDKDVKKQVEKTGKSRAGEPHPSAHRCVLNDLQLTGHVFGSTVSKGSKDAGIFNFKLSAMLGCFHVEVCDDRRSIADIRVQGANT